MGGTGAVSAEVPTVLVTDDVSGQNRAALATVRALAREGIRSKVTVCGRGSITAASRYCGPALVVPPAGQPGYAAALRRHVEQGQFLATMPSSDVAMVALEHPSAGLVDKALLSGRARDAGLCVLPDRVFESAAELLAAADGFDYPVVVKSVMKSGLGNLQAVRAESPRELASVADAPGRLIVQPFEDGPMSAISGVSWDGELLAVCHQRYLRIWPPRAGVACAAETISGDREVEAGVLRLLGAHRGVFQAQFLGGYLLDVNPRVYGSLPLAVAAGANLPAMVCAAELGHRGPLVRARPGVWFRWLEGDLRNLTDAIRRREMSVGAAVRQLRPRRGTAHSIESLRDPAPLLARARRAVAGRVRA
jgi:predicted ATP-grasp superfamily ATP-dependent carboligase